MESGGDKRMDDGRERRRRGRGGGNMQNTHNGASFIVSHPLSASGFSICILGHVPSASL